MIDNKCIEMIIIILKKNNYKYFSKGIYYSGNFYEVPDCYKTNCIKIQVKKIIKKKY